MRNTTLKMASVAFAASLILGYAQMLFAQQRQTKNHVVVNAHSSKSITNQLKEQRTSQVVVEVSLDKSVPAQRVIELLPSKEVKVEYLIYHWGEHTGWYVLGADESLEEAVTNFSKQHSEFLRSQIIHYSAQNSAQLMSMKSDGASKDQQQIENTQLQLAQEFVDQFLNFQTNGLTLSGFAVKGSADKLSTFVDKFPQSNSSFRTVTSSTESVTTKSKTAIATTAAPTSGTPYPNQPWKFSPSKGVIIYNKDGRYFKSDFIFTDVSGFTSTHMAYEHDIVIWSNKDTYVRAAGGAWYSNLPNAYLDSTLRDEKAIFTIGSAAATKIKTNTTYYTQIPVFVIDENGGPSTGSIEPQLGSWAGSYDDGEDPNEQLEINFCKLVGGAGVLSKGDPAYCVFADQTYRIRDYYSGSGQSVPDFSFDHRVPMTYSWDRNVKTPVINPGSLTSLGPVTATISTETAGANIHYTTDGSDPSPSSPTYTTQLTLTSSVTLKARAFKSELTDSAVASATYTIQPPPPALPTVKGYTWDRIPTANQPFNGTITGTGFVINGTSVFFCITGSTTCYQQPPAGVSVTNSGSLNVSNVNLDAGSWQIYVKTSAGSSAKSAAFMVQIPGSLPTVGGYTWDRTPIGGQPFNGTITGTNFVVNGTLVFFCVNGTSTCYQQPPVGVNVTSSTSLNVNNVNLSAGSWQIYVQTAVGSSAKSAAFTVQTPQSPPTVGSYNWDRTPMGGQPFNGTITGTNFVVNGTSVFFCLTGTSTCYQQPPAGVNVTGSTSLNVSNVNLSAGSWQIYVQTAAGASAKSASFTVQAAPSPPTIGGYNWDRTPMGGQPFNGTITGTSFVVNGTLVFFCVNGTNTCYQQPAAGVNVTSSTSLAVSNVNLSAGSWQIYLQTSAGVSSRSSAFTVQTPPSPPTISGFAWDRTPTAGQPFNGTISGSNFISGATSVFFCVNGSSTCYQHPAAGVNVTSSTSLNVSNVNLSAGSWQIYVQTSIGSSARSASFSVQAAAPTITGYSWTTIPTGGQPFSGTITGTGFVIGGTQVWFCIAGTSTCYQQPPVGVSVTSSTSLNVNNVNLSTGSWQFYLQTSAGTSGRSTTFSVR